ncbi:MAG TPA: hypothetical protein VKP69_10150 [Isosphaeraceae bacterium]|nr:hypothetical protein [Isosphaeraceae bacterium]
MGRWVEEQAERAGRVRKVLDPRCASRVQTLGLDEIRFGGNLPWWAWNQPA